MKKENKLVELSSLFSDEVHQVISKIGIRCDYDSLNQLKRAATSIAANIQEAQYAQSRADFISKFQIALKESNESGEWIRFLGKNKIISQEEYKKLEERCRSIRIALIYSVSTAKKNMKPKN